VTVAARTLREELQPEEFFEGVVIEVRDDVVHLRTVSSNGEEGLATLPMARIPDSERRYAMLGAPVRVSIFSKGPHGRRQWGHRVRFLRPAQWRPPLETTAAVDYLVGQMQKILQPK
jgi:hypothetical protein